MDINISRTDNMGEANASENEMEINVTDDVQAPIKTDYFINVNNTKGENDCTSEMNLIGLGGSVPIYQPKWSTTEMYDYFLSLLANVVPTEAMIQIPHTIKRQPGNLWKCVTMPYPRGQSCLIIAIGGVTYAYDAIGRQLHAFRHDSPEIHLGTDINSATVIECVYSMRTGHHMVVDILYHNGISFLNKRAISRFTWLKNNIDVINNIAPITWKGLSDPNFIVLDVFETNEDFFGNFSWPNNYPDLAGFRLYNKYYNYISGQSRFVGYVPLLLATKVLGFKMNLINEKTTKSSNTDDNEQIL